MNKGELIRNVAEKTGLAKKDVESAVNAILSEIKASLSQGEEVRVIGFGSFSVVERAARTGRNPQTGKTIQIPSKKTVRFKAGKAFRSAIA